MQKSPHAGQPLESAGVPLLEARAAMVMLHGRGASAEDILTVADQLDQGGFTYLAPQAAESSWWPKSFRAPIEENEPWLSGALEAVGEALAVAERAGVPADRVMLLGFSQGACLALEYAARNPRQYGGVVGLTGALVGPDGMPQDRPGSLAQTPVFLGCGDRDPHIPAFRVEETEAALAGMGATVTRRIYPGLEHTVNQDEIDFVKRMMAGVLDFSR
ncbi:MAG: dienelactone hydrolase family protein [Candidatus Dormibacteraeota bacterium]|nr:dienelactone hydrolase family protein [Candidatus Dormibacteraeota bacterium]